MSPRRSKLEIRLEILAAVKQGVDKPTRIMYAANMSWKPVQRILSHLVEHGLLAEIVHTESKQSKRRYQITEKGEQILDYFEKAKDIMPLENIYAGD
jgi:predicted transcriptional regulator